MLNVQYEYNDMIWYDAIWNCTKAGYLFIFSLPLEENARFSSRKEKKSRQEVKKTRVNRKRKKKQIVLKRNSNTRRKWGQERKWGDFAYKTDKEPKLIEEANTDEIFVSK